MQAEKIKMVEMLRCLVCGRNAWPTSYGRGQKHGHQIDSLVLNNKGVKRFKWARKNRSRDRDYLIMWRELLTAHLDRLDAILEALGETFVDEPEIVKPPELVVRSSKSFRWSPVSARMSPSIVRQVPVVLRG